MIKLKDIEEKINGKYEIAKFNTSETYSIRLTNGVTINLNYTNGEFKKIVVDGGDKEKVAELKTVLGVE